jgi:hypothetical protein
MLVGMFVFAQEDKQELTPAELAEAQLIAYNNGDVESFMAVFHEDISIWNFGDNEPQVKGFEEVKKIYAALFEASPNLNSKVVNRTIIGNKVLDYEYITGRGGNFNEPFFLVMIYEMKEGKIWKATAIRE